MSSLDPTIAANPDQLRRSAELSKLAPEYPSIIADRYERKGLLAKGGMGSVHTAWDRTLQRTVAIKLIHAKSADRVGLVRFRHESLISGQLQHPNIPPIYDFGLYDGQKPFLVMKLVEGRTLADHLKAPGADTPNLFAVFESICHAIGYAHSRRVIHRDLKPLNVMVGAFGEVQVMDWGLSKAMATEDQNLNEPDSTDFDLTLNSDTKTGEVEPSIDTRTNAGTILGTPAYMPPEQANGLIDQVGERSDVFGLGAILCAILTGKAVYTGVGTESTRQMAARAETNEAFDRLNASGAEFEFIALAKRCLAEAPADRFANGTEVASEVARIRAAADERAKQAELRRARSDARRRVLLGSAAAVIAVLAAGVGISLVQRNRARDAEQATATQLLQTLIEEKRAIDAEATANARASDLLKTLAIVDARTKLLTEAYGDFVFGIQNQLESRPGTHDLRRTLLNQARNGLKKILDDARIHGRPDRTLVWSHLRLGDLEWQLGNTVAAREAFQSGHDLAKELADADPKSLEAQRDRCASLQRLGTAAQRLSQPDEAKAYFTMSLEIRKRLASKDSNDDRTQSDLSRDYSLLGDVAMQSGKFTDAYNSFKESLAIRSRLADAHPNNVAYQRDLSAIHGKLGNAAFRQARLEEAEGCFRQSLAVRERLAAADPKNGGLQRELSAAYDDLGNVAMKRLKPAEAAIYFRQALTVGEQLAGNDPRNVELQRDLVVSCDKLGDAHRRLGQLDEAMSLYLRSLAVRERRADADTKNIQTQMDLFAGYCKFAAVEQERFDYRNATVWYEKARKLAIPLHEAKRLVGPHKDAVRIMDREIAFCRIAENAIADPEFAYAKAPDRIPDLSIIRVKALLHRRKPAEALATAKRFAAWARQQSRNRGSDCYDAARAIALCAAAIEKDREALIDETIALLKKSRAGGYFELLPDAYFERQTEFDGIRQHPKFADFSK